MREGGRHPAAHAAGQLDRNAGQNVNADERRAECRWGHPATKRTRRFRRGRPIPAHPGHSRGLRSRFTADAGHQTNHRRRNRAGNRGRMGVSKGSEQNSAFLGLRSVLEARRTRRLVWDPHWPMGARRRKPAMARLRERALGSDSACRGQRVCRVRRCAERCCVCAVRVRRSPRKSPLMYRQTGEISRSGLSGTWANGLIRRFCRP